MLCIQFIRLLFFFFNFFDLNSCRLGRTYLRKGSTDPDGMGCLLLLLLLLVDVAVFVCCCCCCCLNCFGGMADVNKYRNHSCLQLFMPAHMHCISPGIFVSSCCCCCISLPSFQCNPFCFKSMHSLSILHLQIIDNKLEWKIEDSLG